MYDLYIRFVDNIFNWAWDFFFAHLKGFKYSYQTQIILLNINDLFAHG